VAGDGQAVNAGDGGSAKAASVCSPSGIAVVAASGNIYVASLCNVVRMIAKSSGIISTIAGTGSVGYSGDGGPATAATLNQPTSVAIDSLTSNLYIADTGNSVIRMITKSTGIISTVAGTGTAGYTVGGGLATKTKLSNPLGVGIDNSLRLIYIADSSNNRVLMISMSSGVISRIAGANFSSSFSGDGGKAKIAGLANPTSIAVDPTSSNIYIADALNNRVRMIAKSTGIITTVVGSGAAGESGDGGLALNATLNGPACLAVDRSTGNIYIAVVSRIRMLRVSSGRIEAVAGTGVPGYSGDGGLATAAQLSLPMAVAVDSSSGAALIADTANNRIRSITGTPSSTYSPTARPLPAPAPSRSPYQLPIASPDKTLSPTMSPSSAPPSDTIRPFSGMCCPYHLDT
jgi:trimeric autotransporter adhesin